MGIYLLAVQPVALFFEHHQGAELVRPNFIETDPDAQLQGRPEIECAPDEKPGLGILCCVELVERAVVAPVAVVGPIRTDAGIAQFIAPQRPVNEESQGGVFRPLPGCQFGPPVSWKLASRASMAAFTATAW
jgi:hypothetical protein